MPPPPPVGIPSALHLLRSVEQFELSVRLSNCLRNDNIRYIGEVVQKSELEMLRTTFFGSKVLKEIKGVLAQLDLHLGMEVPGWPPENLEALSVCANWMFKPLDEIVLSLRSIHCLRYDNINYVGELVQKSEAEILRTPNFGRKSVNDVKEVLAKMGLHLGMDISRWPPEMARE